MTIKQTEQYNKLKKARSQLFDLANSFAGDETGHIAVTLHESCNLILRCMNALENNQEPSIDEYIIRHLSRI